MLLFGLTVVYALVFFIPKKGYSFGERFGIAATIAGFVLSTIATYVRVFPEKYPRKKLRESNLELEIRDKNGRVLATDIDPGDVKKIAQVFAEVKSASQ